MLIIIDALQFIILGKVLVHSTLQHHWMIYIGYFCSEDTSHVNHATDMVHSVRG